MEVALERAYPISFADQEPMHTSSRGPVRLLENLSKQITRVASHSLEFLGFSSRLLFRAYLRHEFRFDKMSASFKFACCRNSCRSNHEYHLQGPSGSQSTYSPSSEWTPGFFSDVVRHSEK